MRLASRGLGGGAVLLLAALLLVAFAPPGSGEAEAQSGRVRLIMVDDPNCWFCRQWNEKVGRGYAQSPEGKIAPLRRVARGAPELKGLTPVVLTPTFIVMEGSREVGRISGFSGPSYFYEDLRDILTRAGYRHGS